MFKKTHDWNGLKLGANPTSLGLVKYSSQMIWVWFATRSNTLEFSYILDSIAGRSDKILDPTFLIQLHVKVQAHINLTIILDHILLGLTTCWVY